ncbi:hypothetical protein J008_00389, partial [Cryptococcus neoformans]
MTTIVKIAHEHGFYRRIMRPGGGSTRRPRTTRRAGEAYAPQHILPTFHSGRQSLTVWGAISYY